MKKNLTAIVLSIILLFSSVGCAPTTTMVADYPPSYSMFISVEQTYKYQVVYHRDSKVMYAISNGSENEGTFTLLVNADGSPMIYSGY